MRKGFTVAAGTLIACCLAVLPDGRAVGPLPGVPPASIPNPDFHVRSAAAYVSTAEDYLAPDGKKVEGHHAFDTEDMPYVRFISFWNVPDPDYLITLRLLLNVWCQQMSFNTHTELPKEVPGTDGKLVWIDLRDYRWNPAAWQAVAERERYLLEPWIDHEQTEYLRRKLVAPLSDAAFKGRVIAAGAGTTRTEVVLPAGTMVTGIQFLRDTMETDRVPSYYDLLFAEFRYKQVRVDGGAVEKPVVALVPAVGEFYRDLGDGRGVRINNGDPLPTDAKVYQWVNEGWKLYTPAVVAVQRELPTGKIAAQFADFPANLADWEKAFGVDRVRDVMRERKIDLDFGSIVDGGEDSKNGSMVALRNRLLVTVVGPLGAHMETYDVKEATGVRDFSEATIFGGKKFVPGSGVVAVRDAAEILSYLPNGGQAGLLVNGAGLRQEFAPNDIALDGGATGMDRRVRNVGSCVVCHAPSGGWIPPNDAIRESEAKGVRVKFKDREQEIRFKGFIADQSRRMKAWTEPYLDLIERTTRLPLADGKPGKGWSGSQFAKEVERFRRYYDVPVTLELAAAEVGVPVVELKRLLLKMPFNRGRRLAHGIACPRRTWEVDLFPNVQILRQAEVDEAKKGVGK